ncbi:ROK family transcriptional regulator [Kineococcus sp. SYSU DK005]|uniref:ROK family transcriptional regulator n=1 Tax=Kineococcus sp. SYSU DK005 TaxID=3383126 RepID=UPI003D7CDE12
MSSSRQPAQASARERDGALTARLLTLVSSGRATSRSELARELGVAASTISARVQDLIEADVVQEVGSGPSRGGRRPRLLQLKGEGGAVLVADLGGSHARIAAMDLTARLSHVSEVAAPVASGAGPEVALEIVAEAFDALLQQAAGVRVRGVALALPGPVDVQRQWVESPSRMPGWHRFPVGRWLSERFQVPVLVDNDATLMAYGEHASAAQPLQHSITVKAGSAIGSGIVVDGSVYRGADGAAGDFTHARVRAAAERPCSCGNTGCLETIASGAAIVQELRAHGRQVGDTAAAIALAREGDPAASTLIRSAGRHLGEVLCTVVNFFNPQAIFLGGGMSTLEPFVAAVRSQVYEGSHALATKHLIIAQAATGADAGLVGAGRLLLQQVLHTPAASPEHRDPEIGDLAGHR